MHKYNRAWLITLEGTHQFYLQEHNIVESLCFVSFNTTGWIDIS